MQVEDEEPDHRRSLLRWRDSGHATWDGRVVLFSNQTILIRIRSFALHQVNQWPHNPHVGSVQVPHHSSRQKSKDAANDETALAIEQINRTQSADQTRVKPCKDMDGR